MNLRGWLRLERLASFLCADRGTLPPADPRVERVARVLVVLATLWFGLAAAWEIAAPFAAGHYAAATAVASGGENMWRWNVLAPLTHYTLGPPGRDEFYCHHPFGLFWTAALFAKVFGHHYWVCRLPAVLMSAAMPSLLYGFGRAAWGPIAGAVSAYAFTVVPIALAFANFHALEVPVMFGIALTAWGYVRLGQSGRRRWLWVALGGLLFALNADWSAFVFAGCLLPVAFARGFLLRRFLPGFAYKRFALFWAWASCLTVATAVGYLAAFHSLGQLEDFLRQGEFRSAGSKQSLAFVIEARRIWIDTAFTPLAIVLGKLAAPLLALRLVLLRRDAEWVPLAVLGMAVFQYVVFKQGADIHFFWPHYFALYFAYSMGALTQTFESAFVRLFGRLGLPRARALVPFVALAAFAGTATLILPDGLRALVFGRKTGGRFNEKGSIIHPDIDKAFALEFLARRLERGTSVVIHPSMKQSYFMDFVFERPVRTGKLPRGKNETQDRYFVLDARFSSADELQALYAAESVIAVGPFWYVDRAKPKASPEAYRIARREPSLLESYFVLGSHAPRAIERDPWATWELVDAFSKEEARLPQGEPKAFEQLRIAHNAALASGDTARAKHWLTRLLQDVPDRPKCRYDDGTELVGVRYEKGSSDVLTLYFRAAGGNENPRRFRIDSVVEAAAPGSLVGPDPVVREVGMPFAVPAELWKDGYIYSSVTEILKRPGRERFFGSFEGPGAPVSENCSVDRSLLVLE